MCITTSGLKEAPLRGHFGGSELLVFWEVNKHSDEDGCVGVSWDSKEVAEG